MEGSDVRMHRVRVAAERLRSSATEGLWSFGIGGDRDKRRFAVECNLCADSVLTQHTGRTDWHAVTQLEILYAQRDRRLWSSLIFVNGGTVRLPSSTRHPRTAYELSQSQVATPESVVSLFWQLTGKYRSSLKTVLDMGAGDCRFGRGGNCERYLGVEIDKNRVALARPPANGKIVHGCVFEHGESGFDACIGNPPYARHHDIEVSWKNRTVARLDRELGTSLNRHCNLYIYFLCLALLKSRRDGLVALVIPYEWVSRPAARAVRDYILAQGWNVDVYRFETPIFEGVMTTASISVVDKARNQRRWRYYDITSRYRVKRRLGVTNSRQGLLHYERRGELWALRGLSPGSQKIFTLTEGERIHAGLSRSDVVPCVTTLRNSPRGLQTLSAKAFREHFIEAGERCWLIRSNAEKRSVALDAYLSAIPAKTRDNYTCRHQEPWFNYEAHPVPRLLFSSGFTKFGPKVLVNLVGARAVGSVMGIHGKGGTSMQRLRSYLVRINFERRIVAHARKLKKVEVKQLNGVLSSFLQREKNNGRESSRRQAD